MGYTLPSPTNFGGLPQLSRQAIAFILDPTKFGINRWAEYRPADGATGLYVLLDSDEPYRIVDANEFAWPDGANRPFSAAHQLSSNTKAYVCKRNNLGTQIGKLTSDLSQWNVLTANTKAFLTRMMTLRTLVAVQTLENPANWGSYTQTAQALSGKTGNWGQATNDTGAVAGRMIRETVNAAVDAVMTATGNTVTPEDLRLIISPGAARVMVRTDEIQDVLKQSQFAMELLTGMTATGERNPNHRFGLPSQLFGVELAIEGAVYTDARRTAAAGEAGAKKRIKASQSAILLTKQGPPIPESVFDGNTDGGNAVGKVPDVSLSTFQIFHLGALLEAEQFPDIENRLTRVHVTENVDHQLAAPMSGMLITGILP